MKFKQVVSAVVLSAGVMSAMAGGPITLINTSPGEYSGSFSGNLVFDQFTLDLSFLTGSTVATSVVTANLIFGSGYDITSVMFDGAPYGALQNSPAPVAINVFQFQGPVTNTLHTITVSGISAGGSFTGSVGISNNVTPPVIQPTPVPEPETYALMLAGIGAVGFVVMRRRS